MANTRYPSSDKSGKRTIDPKILDDYLHYMDAVKGISQNTLSGYRSHLLRLFRFLLLHRNVSVEEHTSKGQASQEQASEKHTSEKNASDEPASGEHTFEKPPHTNTSGINTQTLSAVTLQDLHAFLTHMKNEHASNENARARIVTCIRSFFLYLVSKAKKFTRNPALGLESPKCPKTQPRYLSLAESLRLLDAIRGADFERDYAILTLFLNTGIRMSELTGIDIKDIRDNCLTILGKGDKERTAYLNTACQYAIAAYLKSRPTDEVCGTNALFLNRKMQRISGTQVNALIKIHLAAAGLDAKKYSAHKLRHTAATLMYKYGKVDIRALQDILGHSKIETTMIYTHLDEQTLQDAMDRNPLSNDKSAGSRKKRPSPKK